MKPSLSDFIVCFHCGDELLHKTDNLVCQGCGDLVPLQGGIPIFTPVQEDIRPSEKMVRGPNLGTPWRQANWCFLEKQIAQLEPDEAILEIGAGRGDFSDIFEGRKYLALDIYPYPEVDVVCDLTQVNPFRPDSFGAVVLMNVLEHVYDTNALMSVLRKLIRPGGVLIVTIPFLVKMHQVPVDFVRYTHFALKRLGNQHELITEQLEGFYDPIFLLDQGTGNLKWSVLPTIRGWRHYLGRSLLWGIQAAFKGLRAVVGKGRAQSPNKARSLAPVGYHVVYRREKELPPRSTLT